MKNTFKTLAIIVITAIITLGMAACASFTIVSVEWDTLKGPGQVRQFYNIPITDISLYANYKDESRKRVTMISSSHNRERAGIQTVTVTVLGKGSDTFQTEVMELLNIRIERQPTKTTYNVGETANLSGIRVIGSWKDMSDEEIPNM